MYKRQIYSKIRVLKNYRGTKSEGAQQLEARKLKARNSKGANFNGNKVDVLKLRI